MKKKIFVSIVILFSLISLTFLTVKIHQVYKNHQNLVNAKTDFVSAYRTKDYQTMLIALTNSTYFDSILTKEGYSHKINKNSINEIVISKNPEIIVSAPFENRQLGGKSLVQEFHYTDISGDIKTVCRFGTEESFYVDENGVGASYFMEDQYTKNGNIWKPSKSDFSGYMTPEKNEIRKITEEKLFVMFEAVNSELGK